jgi:hypothetical protein
MAQIGATADFVDSEIRDIVQQACDFRSEYSNLGLALICPSMTFLSNKSRVV